MSVVNESDQDVVVRAETDAGTYSKVVPARTGGTVFNSFTSARDTWTVVVFDGSCGRLTEIPFQDGGQVHLGTDGTISIEPFEWRGAPDIPRVTLTDQSCP
jgi:hypothetical protein